MSNTFNPGESHTDAPTPQTGLSMEEIFDILSAKERQFTVLLLTHRDGPVPLDDVVTHITSELDVGDDRFDRPRERIYIKLCHCHLPKLLERGVIEYDEQHRITRGRNFEQLTPALEFVQGESSLERKERA